MSNYLAIAAVTAALQDILQEAAVAAVSGTDVTIRRPETISSDGQEKAAVNLYLYQATPDPGWTNADLSTRNGNGLLVRRPQVALNLDYLISFHGSELVMEPQRLLGSVISAFHAYPIFEMNTILEHWRGNKLQFQEGKRTSLIKLQGTATAINTGAIIQVMCNPEPLDLI